MKGLKWLRDVTMTLSKMCKLYTELKGGDGIVFKKAICAINSPKAMILLI